MPAESRKYRSTIESKTPISTAIESAERNGSRSKQAIIFESMNSTEAYLIVFVFSPLPNVLVSTLNATETVNIIIELRFKSNVIFVGLHIFIVEKADDDSLVIFNR
jgi:hypothetical protein